MGKSKLFGFKNTNSNSNPWNGNLTGSQCSWTSNPQNVQSWDGKTLVSPPVLHFDGYRYVMFISAGGVGSDPLNPDLPTLIHYEKVDDNNQSSPAGTYVSSQGNCVSPSTLTITSI